MARFNNKIDSWIHFSTALDKESIDVQYLSPYILLFLIKIILH